MTSKPNGKNVTGQTGQAVPTDGPGAVPDTNAQSSAPGAGVTRRPTGVKDAGYPVLKRPPLERVTPVEPAAPTATPAPRPTPVPRPTAEAPAATVEDTAIIAKTAPAAAPESAAAAASNEATGPSGTDVSEDSPLDELGSGESGRSWPRTLLWSGVVVLVLAGAYVGAQWFYADRVARDTTVAGIDIGGLSHDAAVAKLDSELGGVAVAPLPVAGGDASTTLDPAGAGLTFDAAATVKDLTVFTLNPSNLIAQITGGGAVTPVTTVDDALLTAAVEAMAQDLAVPAQNGTVGFVDGAPVQTAAVDGSGIEVGTAKEIVTTTWLTAARPLVLPTVPVAPEITQAETDAAFAVAQTVVSGPVTVAVGEQNVEIPADFLAAAASFAETDGDLALTFDGVALTEDIVSRTKDLLTESADAKFVFVDGKPTIDAGVPGTTLDPVALSTAVATAATGTDRSTTTELVTSDPAQSVAALEALGVNEIVAEFATPLTNEPVRTENLRIAAERVTGTLIEPGGTFDLTEVIGPITKENGYQSAHIISNGYLIDGIGGGLSQMSTTTYNAGFFAGMVDLEHRPHSYWFSRYPEGRESTLAVGQINMRWRNDSPHGVLLRSWISGNQLHVQAWSTKYYDVQTTTSPRSNVVAPSAVVKSGAGCTPSGAGSPGFSVSVWRKVTIIATGEEVINETNTWRYSPMNAISCE